MEEVNPGWCGYEIPGCFSRLATVVVMVISSPLSSMLPSSLRFHSISQEKYPLFKVNKKDFVMSVFCCLPFEKWSTAGSDGGYRNRPDGRLLGYVNNVSLLPVITTTQQHKPTVLRDETIHVNNKKVTEQLCLLVPSIHQPGWHRHSFAFKVLRYNGGTELKRPRS